VLALAAAPALAAPRIPASDAEVVERLPYKASDPANRELRRLREALASDPRNMESAVRLSRRYFELAAAEGDPRYIGYAEAVLRPWTQQQEVPAAVKMERALLRQYRHDFEPALADLDGVLAADTDNIEAMYWRVAIFMVQAEYAKARDGCLQTEPYATELSVIACTATVDGVTGHARAAYQALTAALAKHPTGNADQAQWVQTRLAEMALRMGDRPVAEKHFRAAMAAGEPDGFVLAAYADFLLDENRPAEVVPLLRDWVRSDILLLRLALAESRLKLPAAAEHVAALRERFAAAALRGDRLHLQEEARFELALRGDAGRAVQLAAENYKVQREPRDARVLLEAAIAARKPAAAKPALDWMQSAGYEEPRYRELAETLRKMPQ
jgi:predicted Zn-dependent protease